MNSVFAAANDRVVGQKGHQFSGPCNAIRVLRGRRDLDLDRHSCSDGNKLDVSIEQPDLGLISEPVRACLSADSSFVMRLATHAGRWHQRLLDTAVSHALDVLRICRDLSVFPPRFCQWTDGADLSDDSILSVRVSGHSAYETVRSRPQQIRSQPP